MVQLSKEEFEKILKETVQAELKAFREQQLPGPQQQPTTLPSIDSLKTQIAVLATQRSKLYDELSSVGADQKAALDGQLAVISAQIDALEQALIDQVGGANFGQSLKRFPIETQAEYKKMVLEGKTVADIAKLLEAEWDSAYITALPDSAFAVDRKLPHHNSAGGLDVPHLQNGLVRCNQITDASKTAAKDHLCAHAKAEGIQSPFCGLAESTYLVEARKEIVDLKAKVADAEKKLNEAKAKTFMLAKTIEGQIPPNAGLRFFNPGARRVVEDIKRTLLPFKESK